MAEDQGYKMNEWFIEDGVKAYAYCKQLLSQPNSTSTQPQLELEWLHNALDHPTPQPHPTHPMKLCAVVVQLLTTHMATATANVSQPKSDFSLIWPPSPQNDATFGQP